jgi:aryl-alcohol dehydrogenase-like predicted oxidoreductase
MKTVELGRTGEHVSQLALGCMLMGTATGEEDSLRMLDEFVAAGGTFLDTANCYSWTEPGTRGGESESLLGRWFTRRGRRDDVFLATKGGAMVDDPDGLRGVDWGVVETRFEGAGADTLRVALDDSLRRLRTDHVDLYYVHVDDRSTPLEETLSALHDLVQAGKTRYIGWSNVTTWRLERIRQLCDRHGWTAPVALQQQHSYLRPRPGAGSLASIVDGEQLDYLRAHENLTLVAYSPILKGIYDNPAKRTEHWIMNAYAGPDSEARLGRVDAMAAELGGVTSTQLVLAWLLHQTAPVIVPLVGPRTPAQLTASLAAVDITLTDDQLARLERE